MHLGHRLVSALVVIGVSAPALHAAAPSLPFEVVDIGTLTGMTYSVGWGVSNTGYVAGIGSNGINFQQGFNWRADTGLHWLAHPSGSIGESVARRINDAGQALGTAFGPTQGVLWNTDGSVSHAFNIAGVDQPTGLNNVGSVSGYRSTPGGQNAYIWNGLYIDLGFPSPATNSQGYDINNSGKVAGTLNGGVKSSPFSSAPAAFLWSPGSGFQTITTSSAFQNISIDDLSDQGTMVGVGYSSGGAGTSGWKWDSSGGFTTLANLLSSTSTDARGVNDADLVVGRSGLFGTLWDSQGNVYKVNDLLAPGFSAWNITSLWSINNDGWMTGEAVLSGNAGTRAVLLRPIPEPASGGLLMLSCAILLGQRRRKNC